MFNTVMQEVIHHQEIMHQDEFIEWFKNNKETFIEREKKIIIGSANQHEHFQKRGKSQKTPAYNGEEYYERFFSGGYKTDALEF